jgi:hypothetical protein
MKPALLGAALMLTVFGIAVLLYAPANTPRETILHAKGPCPSGYSLAPKVFREKDGSTQDACVKEDSDEMTIDRLNPGESIEMRLEIPADDLLKPQPGKS